MRDAPAGAGGNQTSRPEQEDKAGGWRNTAARSRLGEVGDKERQTRALRRAEIWVLGALWGLVFAVSLLPAWQLVEVLGFDLLSRLSPPSAVESPIVIVAIDEQSFAEIGHRWPWPRKLHARLLDALAAEGAAVVGFDILFSEPSHEPNEDEELAAALARQRRVVLAAATQLINGPHATLKVRVTPLSDFIAAGAASGLADVDLDPDTVQRRVPTDPESFWVRILEAYGGKPPVEKASGMLVRYAGPPDSFLRVSYYQALDPIRHLPPRSFTDRIVLVGFHTRVPPTPDQQQVEMIATPFFGSSGQLSSGVEVQANIIEAARLNRFVEPASLAARQSLMIVLALGTIGFATRVSPLIAAGGGLCLASGVVAVSASLFHFSDIWLPVGAPILGIGLTLVGHSGFAFAREQARRRFVQKAFGKYVSEPVIDYMLQNPELLVLGGERREVSVLCTDLAGYTTLGETLPPQIMIELMSEYFDALCATVLSFAGTIDRFVGDALVVLFNAPADQPDHPRRAVECALALDLCAQTFASRTRVTGIAWGDTRIGVSTGETTVGNIGGVSRFNYTAIGDAMNIAARLEGANKVFGTRVCVSGATASSCPRGAFAFRPIGSVLLKGKSHAVEVWEPLPASAAQSPAFAAYMTAYRALESGDESATGAFAAAAALSPNDPLVQLHMIRLQRGETGVNMLLREK